jgi:hypothetical protein
VSLCKSWHDRRGRADGCPFCPSQMNDPVEATQLGDDEMPQQLELSTWLAQSLSRLRGDVGGSGRVLHETKATLLSDVQRLGFTGEAARFVRYLLCGSPRYLVRDAATAWGAPCSWQRQLR